MLPPICIRWISRLQTGTSLVSPDNQGDSPRRASILQARIEAVTERMVDCLGQVHGPLQERIVSTRPTGPERRAARAALPSLRASSPSLIFYQMTLPNSFSRKSGANRASPPLRRRSAPFESGSRTNHLMATLASTTTFTGHDHRAGAARCRSRACLCSALGSLRPAP
jgi:hypothetical protein